MHYTELNHCLDDYTEWLCTNQPTNAAMEEHLVFLRSVLRGFPQIFLLMRNEIREQQLSNASPLLADSPSLLIPWN